MNPERLLQHFDRLAEAPDAVPRLRRFILDLTARGKLVEQDPEDMRNALIPLPPLAEQHRIVAKVDELMALCDRLEAQLATTRDWHSARANSAWWR